MAGMLGGCGGGCCTVNGRRKSVRRREVTVDGKQWGVVENITKSSTGQYNWARAAPAGGRSGAGTRGSGLIGRPLPSGPRAFGRLAALVRHCTEPAPASQLSLDGHHSKVCDASVAHAARGVPRVGFELLWRPALGAHCAAGVARHATLGYQSGGRGNVVHQPQCRGVWNIAASKALCPAHPLTLALGPRADVAERVLWVAVGLVAEALPADAGPVWVVACRRPESNGRAAQYANKL